MQRKHGCKVDGMLGANTQETVALWKCNNKQTKREGEERGDERETRKRQERDDLGRGPLLVVDKVVDTNWSPHIPPKNGWGSGEGTRCLYGLYGPKGLRIQTKGIDTKAHTRN